MVPSLASLVTFCVSLILFGLDIVVPSSISAVMGRSTQCPPLPPGLVVTCYFSFLLFGLNTAVSLSILATRLRSTHCPPLPPRLVVGCPSFFLESMPRSTCPFPLQVIGVHSLLPHLHGWLLYVPPLSQT